MVKKSISFENELMYGMRRELQSYELKHGIQNLDKAVGQLQAAVEIFEEFGMQSRADQILNILNKIAHNYNPEDIIEFTSLKNEEPSLKNPRGKFKEIKPDDIIEFTSLQNEFDPTSSEEEFSFQSLLSNDGQLDYQDARGKSKNPAKINDRHTQGLNSAKMEKNLKDHGHPMNLVDDGNNEDYEYWFDQAKEDLIDHSHASDLLNVDIGENKPDVENFQDETFEDSD